MTKTKIILGLTMMLSILAITTTPAAAKFRAVTSGRTSGSSQLKSGTNASLTLSPAGAEFTSSKAPDTWRIQNSKAEQNPTKEGDHLDQELNFEEIRTSELHFTINNPITYQIIQTGPTTADIAISKTIVLSTQVTETGTCRVIIPQSAANKQLTKAKLTNIESSKALEISSELENINIEASEACALLGILSSSKGAFKQITIEHGVIAV